MPRVAVDLICASLTLGAAVVSTIEESPNSIPPASPASPLSSSVVTFLWSLLFFMFTTFAILDGQPRQHLGPIVADISSLLLLLLSVAWLWATYNPADLSQLHLFGNQLSVLRVSVFSVAVALRFVVSVLCCWECRRRNRHAAPNNETTTTTTTHADYIPLSSHIDDEEEYHDEDDMSSEEDTAGAWSRLCFCWITPMLHRGYEQRRLDKTDLPNLAKIDAPRRVYLRFLHLWRNQHFSSSSSFSSTTTSTSTKTHLSLLRTLHQLVFYRFYGSGLLLALSMAAGFAQPILLHDLLVHLEAGVAAAAAGGGGGGGGGGVGGNGSVRILVTACGLT